MLAEQIIRKTEGIYAVVYPELTATAIAKKEDDLYAFYCILKALNNYLSSGSGLIKYADIVHLYATIFQVSAKQTRRRLQQGHNIYWRYSHKAQTIGLKHIDYIWEHLGHYSGRACPFEVPMRVFFNNTEHTGRTYIKHLLICIFAARHNDMRPVSHRHIAEQMNISTRTVIRALQNPILITKTNFAIKYISNEQLGMRRILSAQNIAGGWVWNHSHPKIMKRLGNSYYLPWERLPLKKRPKYAKAQDSITVKKPKPDMLGYFDFPSFGKVKIWKHFTDKTQAQYMPESFANQRHQGFQMFGTRL